MRSDSELRNFYEAMRARGESHPDAKVALARKLASLTLSLLKNNEAYHDDWEDKIRKRTELRKKLIKQERLGFHSSEFYMDVKYEVSLPSFFKTSEADNLY